MSAERKLAEEALHDFEHYASEVHDGIDECAEDVADAAGRILDLVDKLVAERDAALAKLSDPRIEAWRTLDAETRSRVLNNLRGDWPPYDAREHAAAALEAAAVLAALGEQP